LPKNHKIITKGNNLVFRDIKQTALTEEELEEMYLLSNSYEVLFSKKSPIVSMDLKNKSLTEADYKYILEHYTFLSRPVLSSTITFILVEPTKHASSNESIGNV
jgi:arsenate reductase